MKRLAIGLTAAVTGILVTLPTASAAINVGLVGDPAASECDPNFDFFATSGPGGSNPFTITETGEITSWTTFASAVPGQRLEMKVFRKVADPLTFQAVGHAGPQTLTPGGTAGNTFPASIAVKPGDILGLHNLDDNTHCAVLSPEWAFNLFDGDLADGQAQPFTASLGGYPDVQANLVPDNTFRLAKTKRNPRKGNATLTFDLPNPGTISGSGGGAKVAKSKSVAAGKAKLKVKARGSKSQTLNSDGKVKLKLQVIYTPTGGDPKAKKLKVKLLKS